MAADGFSAGKEGLMRPSTLKVLKGAKDDVTAGGILGLMSRWTLGLPSQQLKQMT